MLDSLGRKIEYMRISVTDRCNLRCRYCMPEELEKFPKEKILSYEEIIKIQEASLNLGIDKFRITGGEPLVRKDIGILIRGLKETSGTKQVMMTTNGMLLMDHLDDLVRSGLDSLNISLQSLDPERYRYITGGGDLWTVMDAVKLASQSPIRTKLNCVLHRDIQKSDIIGLTELAETNGIDIRFIEMMPIGFGSDWKGPDKESVLKIISDEMGEPDKEDVIRGNGPAVYYRLPSRKVTIGFISPLSDSFCSTCNRIRLDSLGRLRTCLGSQDMTDLRPYLKGDKDVLREIMRQAVLHKPEGHCLVNNGISGSMSAIGG